jgi:hypothetical protein
MLWHVLLLWSRATRYSYLHPLLTSVVCSAKILGWSFPFLSILLIIWPVVIRILSASLLMLWLDYFFWMLEWFFYVFSLSVFCHDVTASWNIKIQIIQIVQASFAEREYNPCFCWPSTSKSNLWHDVCRWLKAPYWIPCCPSNKASRCSS